MLLNLKEEFYKWTVDWENKLNEDEWYFVRFREYVVDKLSTEQAYNLISEATELVLEQTNQFLLDECFEILLSLCFQSDTTSIPPFLQTNWEKLKKLLSSQDKYNNRFVALQRWYRIN